MTHSIRVSRRGLYGYLARRVDAEGFAVGQQWVHARTLEDLSREIVRIWPDITTVRTSQELAGKLRQAGYQGELEVEIE
jgi:hypothetical protein